LEYLVELLGENDRLCLIQFDHNAERMTPLRKVKNNKNELLQAISSLNDAGGTNIAFGMQKAFKVIQQRKYRNAVTSIFLLSDGLDGNA